jgi:type IV pilus assembly protein PilV
MDKTMTNFPNLRDVQQGVTMLEVLISIVVLSFGLLGLLGLLSNGLKMTSSSQYRTIAAQQLTAMADMINANPEIVAKYSPPSGTADSNRCFSMSGCSTTVVTNTTTTGTPPVSTTSTTITSPLPATDYLLWQRDLANNLPSGVGVVCLDSTPADGNSANFACDNTGRPTVKICWNEHDRIAISGGGGSGAAASASAQDTCLTTQL